MLAGDPDELRIHLERPLQLELEVGVMAADREGSQQDRGGEGRPADAPPRDADGQVHGFDAADRAQLGVLGRDALGGQPRGTQAHLVAEEVGEERRLAGDELRETARVRLGDVDAGFRPVAEAAQRRRAAQIGGFGPQARALGLGGVRDPDSGGRVVQVTEGHSVVHRCAVRRPAFPSPHTHTLGATPSEIGIHGGFPVKNSPAPRSADYSSPRVRTLPFSTERGTAPSRAVLRPDSAARMGT